MNQQQATTTPAPGAARVLWGSNRGEVTCGQCGGGYLAAAVAARPDAARHVTPLDVWDRITKRDVQAWDTFAWPQGHAPHPLQCEWCDALPLF